MKYMKTRCIQRDGGHEPTEDYVVTTIGVSDDPKAEFATAFVRLAICKYCGCLYQHSRFEKEELTRKMDEFLRDQA